MKKKFFIIFILLITVIAFIIRLEVSRELHAADPTVSKPSVYTDMYTYRQYSLQIFNANFNKEFYYQPFYYAVFLPFIAFIFGTSITSIIIIQTILSALTVYFAALLSARLFGRIASYITAVLLTFSTMLILYTPYMLIATLQAFWVTLIAYLSIRCIEQERRISGIDLRKSLVYWGGLGLLCSFSILTRGNIWFFIPGIIFILFYLRFRLKKTSQSNLKKVLPIIIYLIALFIPQIPFAWHNSKIKGHICGPSTAGSAVLSLGNTPQAPPGGREPGTGAGPMEYPPACNYWMKTSEDISVFERMFLWFQKQPLAFCELQFRKLILFWNYAEIPNNIAIENNGMKSPTLRHLGLIPCQLQKSSIGNSYLIFKNIIPFSVLILILSFAGCLLYFMQLFRHQASGRIDLFKSIKAHPKIYLILYFIFSYNLATSAFYNLSRFRAPLIPLLAVFAGAFVSFAFKYTKISKRNILTLVFCLLIGLFIVLFSFDFYREVYEAKVMSFVRPNGTSVDLGSYTMLEDNGPLSFGGWEIIPFEKNIQVKKVFSLSEGDKNSGKFIFSLPIIWSKPGRAQLLINGKPVDISSDKMGKKTYEFTINSSSIELSLINSNVPLMLLVDYQRDYGRTIINNKTEPFELVSFLKMNFAEN